MMATSEGSPGEMENPFFTILTSGGHKVTGYLEIMQSSIDDGLNSKQSKESSMSIVTTSGNEGVFLSVLTFEYEEEEEVEHEIGICGSGIVAKALSRCLS